MTPFKTVCIAALLATAAAASFAQTPAPAKDTAAEAHAMAPAKHAKAKHATAKKHHSKAHHSARHAKPAGAGAAASSN